MKDKNVMKKKTNKTGSSIKKGVALGVVGALAYEFLGPDGKKNQKKVMKLLRLVQS